MRYPTVVLLLLLSGCDWAANMETSVVRYEISGSFTAANVGYQNATGNMNRIESAAIPWTLQHRIRPLCVDHSQRVFRLRNL